MRDLIILENQKKHILEKLYAGTSELDAVNASGISRIDFYYAVASDADFRVELQKAKLARADVWFEKVVQDADNVAEKEMVGGEKLRFEKLKYLAEMDNPDKYSPSQKVKHEGGVNILDFKQMSMEDARKALSEDPFAIDADFEVVEDETLDGVGLL